MRSVGRPALPSGSVEHRALAATQNGEHSLTKPRVSVNIARYCVGHPQISVTQNGEQPRRLASGDDIVDDADDPLTALTMAGAACRGAARICGPPLRCVASA